MHHIGRGQQTMQDGKQRGSAWWRIYWGSLLAGMTAFGMMPAPMAAEIALTPVSVCGHAAPAVGIPWFPTCTNSVAEVTWGHTNGYTLVPSGGEVCYQLTRDEQPIGPRLCSAASTFQAKYALSGLEEGSHVLGVRVLDAPASGVQYSAFPQPITVDRVPGARTGGQYVWHCPRDQGFRLGFDYAARGCAKLWYPGTVPDTANPGPVRQPTEHVTVRLAESAMFVEHPQPLSGLYQPQPAFFQTKDGHIIASGLANHYTSDFRLTAEFADTLPRKDGQRGVGFVTNYSTYNIHPVTGDIWFVESVDHGRLGKITREGQITTIAGYRTKADVVPYHPYRNAVVPEQNGTPWASQLELVGQWVDLPGFYLPIDFVFDRANPAIVYVADTGNQCIRKVNTALTPALVTTLAGQCGPESSGSAGFVDGSPASTRFDWPFSITQVSTGLLYVADRGNDAIRRVHPDGSTETPVGMGYRPPPVNYAAGCTVLRSHSRNGSFATASIYHPMVVRADSEDNLLVLEDVTGLVRKVDRMNGQVLPLLDVTGGCVPYQTWLWMDVDRQGTFGPIDEFFVVQDTGGAAFGVQTNEYFWRFAKDGTGRQRLVGAMGGSACNLEVSAAESCGPHYPWAVAVGNGMLCANGWGQTGFMCVRKKLATDPQANIYASPAHFGSQMMQGHGQALLQHGPSLRSVYGWYGDGLTGTSSFDDLASLPDSQLSQYIVDGMGLGVPKPMYGLRQQAWIKAYVRRHSSSQNAGQVSVYSDFTAPSMAGAPVVTRQGDCAFIDFATNEPAIVQVLVDVAGATRTVMPRQEAPGVHATMQHHLVIPFLDPSRGYVVTVRLMDATGNIRSLAVSVP